MPRERVITPKSKPEEFYQAVSSFIGHLAQLLGNPEPDDGESIDLKSIVDKFETVLADSKALRTQNTTLQDTFNSLHAKCEQRGELLIECTLNYTTARTRLAAALERIAELEAAHT